MLLMVTEHLNTIFDRLHFTRKIFIHCPEKEEEGKIFVKEHQQWQTRNVTKKDIVI